MRTTIAIDDDVLLAARALARRDGSSIGTVISELARKGLNSGPQVDAVADSDWLLWIPAASQARQARHERVDRPAAGRGAVTERHSVVATPCPSRDDLRALLDINVLLALLDRDHVLHERGRLWFEQEVRYGWASCAVTQNGFVRILSQPGYPSPVPTGTAMPLLATAAASPVPRRTGPATSRFSTRRSSTTRESTVRDSLPTSYLLGLAAQHDGRLVTFDQTIGLAAVRTARPDNLVVL